MEFYYRMMLRKHVTEVFAEVHCHITADILRQIYYGRYITAGTANVLRQIYYGRYIEAYTASKLGLIYCAPQGQAPFM